ncbi:MAG TPA: hypothetical protein PLO33_14985 [Kouleothrix sp.]|nr:hypothetical protein [Kouleothrix sp.]HRC76982.1 hypothetical protein [Kouleothrix sp.]
MDTFLSFRFLIPAGLLLLPLAVLAFLVISTAIHTPSREDTN